MLIPRLFHQIWVGPDPPPEQFLRYQQTWLDHHPQWEMRFWTEHNLPKGLRRREVYERLRVPAERSDILRLELLWRFGGVYMDMDFECLRSIEPLIGDLDFFAARNEKGLNNALIGSVAAHPVLDKALGMLQPREIYGYSKEATGPIFFERVLQKHLSNAKIFESTLFYPKGHEAREHAYGIHYNANTWKRDGRAEKRMRKAADLEARRWRSKYEQAMAEIATLRDERFET